MERPAAEFLSSILPALVIALTYVETARVPAELDGSVLTCHGLVGSQHIPGERFAVMVTDGSALRILVDDNTIVSSSSLIHDRDDTSEEFRDPVLPRSREWRRA